MAQAGTAEKPKKAKVRQYIGGSEEFGGENNIKVAISRRNAFLETLSEEQQAAFSKLLKDMRDHVGWTKGGRILLKGSADRGN